MTTTVADVVGATLAALGADHVFGVVGSGNFHVTNALVANGVRFVATRHEAGAATVADAYARVSGRPALVSVHQGCGLTNAMTGIAEAAKSRTPMVVLAAEPTSPRSNFWVDQDALAAAVGAVSDRVQGPATAVADVARAWERAVGERRTVLLNLPLDVQAMPAAPGASEPGPHAGPQAGRHAGPQAGPHAGPQAGPHAGPQAGPHVGPQAGPHVGPRPGHWVGTSTPATPDSFLPLSTSPAENKLAEYKLAENKLAENKGVEAPDESVATLAALLRKAARPVFIAGRGAVQARAELEALANETGALLSTSAVARGLFQGSPWSLDVSGGFATPLAAELIAAADLVVAWGASLNMWTTRHGALVGPSATVVQVDLEPAALGAHHRIDLGVVGDVQTLAHAVRQAADPQSAAPQIPAVQSAAPQNPAVQSAAAQNRAVQDAPVRKPAYVGYRTGEIRARIAAEGRWRDIPYADDGDDTHIDPRTATIALDDMLPAARTVAVDSGNFMGYPSMFLGVPDQRGFCFTQAFQSIGLGLASAIGAALAAPDRLPIAACGDGGFLMSIAELDTVRRLGLGMLIVVYNDDAYGAEVHHFGPGGFPLDTVRFPETNLAAIARGHGCAAISVRREADLAPIGDWLAGPREVPMVVDLKVAAGRPSWWLEEAFRGH